MKNRPDAVPVARELWRLVGRDLQKPETQKSCLLPAVVWFLDHPQAVAQAFPNGDMARKIVVFCLDSLENTLFREQGAGKAAYALSNSVTCAAALFWNRSRITTSSLRTRAWLPWAWPW